MSSEGHPVLKVSKDKGEQTLQRLKKQGNLDPDRSIRREGEELIFPVKEGGNCSEEDPDFREQKTKPYQRIKEELDLPESKKRRLPDRWEMIGDVLLIKLPDELLDHKKSIAEVYSSVLSAKTVMLQGSIEGTEREPVVEKIYGDETETVHVENGVKFKIDTSQLMFSSGNIDERIRMAEEVGKGDVVVDMFAGIGYFSLPMAVHGGPEKVYSLDINPTAFRYLEQNIRLNEVQNVVEAWHGDNRDFSFTGADRVVMGYLHETWEFLKRAVEFLDGEGIIHYHTRSLDKKYPEDVIEEVEENISQNYEIRTIKKIKSYAPHVFHVVVDIEVYS
ncbi:MAG: class I SAM-dependent methyltransferase family protein [Candidatus Thermoplasmatota archaeon]